MYFILGNHCAYNSDWEEALDFASRLASEFDNVHFLHRDKIELEDDIVLLGTTLHSYIPPSQEKEVASFINDFYYIKNWSVESHNKEYTENIRWLAEIIPTIPRHKKILALFHYPPYNKGVSHPIFESKNERGLNSAFSSDLSGEDWFTRLDTIVCGHTHFQFDINVNGVRILSNQKGYPNEYPPTENFNSKILLQVTTKAQQDQDRNTIL